MKNALISIHAIIYLIPQSSKAQDDGAAMAAVAGGLIASDESGKASVRFFNSDNSGSVQIDIRGLSPTGKPGAFLKTVRFNEM
jgi:hypothetical protein